MLEKKVLWKMYALEKLSVAQIASKYQCSQSQINYWLQKYSIQKRNISDAVYLRHNPHGDPFSFSVPVTSKQWFLYGLGLGLFWGEGNKMDKNSVRLGNTDIDLIKTFLQFLKDIYKIDNEKLRFGLQLFNDISKEKALKYWSKELGVPKNKFQKVIVTESTQKGTYKKKSQYGVLTIYFSNTKLRDTIISAIEKLRQTKPL